MESPLFSLPAEVLIKIFEHLSYDSLKELQLVCKSFTSIIKNVLMNRERVIFEDNYKFVVSERNSNLKVHSSKVLDLHGLLNTKLRGELIHSLYIHNLDSISVDVDINYFKEVLNCCCNLKDLDTSIEFTKVSPKDLYSNLPLLTLDTLAYSKAPEFFKIFKNCTTKKLKLYFGLDKTLPSLQPIKDFLSTQMRLTELEIWYSGKSLTLFADSQLQNVGFRLKKLKLVGRGLHCSHLPNFDKFLGNHKSTLEHLHLFACQNVIDSFMDFGKLKRVHLEEVFISSDEFPHVEHLSLVNVKGSFVMKFPNTKRLYINTNNLTGVDLRPLSKLISLELSVLKVESISLPNITKMKLTCVSYFSRLNIPCSVEEIELKDCMNIDWLCEYLNENKKLKTVRILSSSISERLMLCIQRNSHVNNYLLLA
jgi:hypothetical protein